MPNYIKYSTNTQTLALKSGNYYIGTGDVRKGPTSTTDYWSCIIPPTSGYTVYLNKVSNGPSIYTCNNDTDLINITNTIAGQSYTSATQCLVYYLGQTDKMCANIDYPSIVTSGLVLNLDAGFVPSYPKSGTTWSDISLSETSGTLTNGPTFDSNNGGSFLFDGTNDYVDVVDNTIFNSTTFSVCAWVKWNSPTDGSRREIFSKFVGGLASYQIRKEQGSNTYGVIMRYSDNTVTTLSGSIPSTNWVFIGTSYNKVTNLFYLNNTLINSDSNTKDLKTDSVIDVAIGVAPFSPLQYFYNGYISSVYVYNRGISAAEILQNYNATKSRFGL
jgi:hypothetical protein